MKWTAEWGYYKRL